MIGKSPVCSCGETDPTMFYGGHKSRCKKCTSKKNKDRYNNMSDANKAAYIEYNSVNYKKWSRDNIFQYRFLCARNRAYKKGIEFDITPEYLAELLDRQNGCCYYSGLKFTEDRHYTWSIDRIDSTKGYTKDNVVLASSIVNTMKNDLPLSEFLTIIKTLASYQQGLLNH